MKLLHHPDRKDIQLASVLYALSDPIRLYVVSEIRKHGEQACNSFKRFAGQTPREALMYAGK